MFATPAMPPLVVCRREVALTAEAMSPVQCKHRRQYGDGCASNVAGTSILSGVSGVVLPHNVVLSPSMSFFQKSTSRTRFRMLLSKDDRVRCGDDGTYRTTFRSKRV